MLGRIEHAHDPWAGMDRHRDRATETLSVDHRLRVALAPRVMLIVAYDHRLASLHHPATDSFPHRETPAPRRLRVPEPGVGDQPEHVSFARSAVAATRLDEEARRVVGALQHVSHGLRLLDPKAT